MVIARSAYRSTRMHIMSEATSEYIDPATVEIVEATPPSASQAVESEGDTIHEPGKVMRIGSMIKQLLEEVRQAPLDERSRIRLREIFEISVRELGSSLSPDLRAELESLAFGFGDEIPSDAELRVAQAQLVGWLEGLFHGIQAALMAQQMAAQAQLQQMRQRGALPPGMMPSGPTQGGDAGAVSADGARPGTYL